MMSWWETIKYYAESVFEAPVVVKKEDDKIKVLVFSDDFEYNLKLKKLAILLERYELCLVSSIYSIARNRHEILFEWCKKEEEKSTSRHKEVEELDSLFHDLLELLKKTAEVKRDIPKRLEELRRRIDELSSIIGELEGDGND